MISSQAKIYMLIGIKSANNTPNKDNRRVNLLVVNTKTLKTIYHVIIYCFLFKQFKSKNHNQTLKTIINQNVIYSGSLNIEKLRFFSQTQFKYGKDAK